MAGNDRPFRDGFVDSLPFLPSGLLWGAIFGAAAVDAGLPGGLAVLMSAIVYSGTAQLAVLKILDQPVLVVFLTSLLLSLRFVPMALSLGPRLRLPRWRRALVAPAIVDAAFARAGDTGLGRYLAGTMLCGYLDWVAGTVAGVMLGPFVPRSWSGLAEGVVVVVFIVLTAELLSSWPALLAAALGGLLAVVLAGLLPAGAALTIAALAAGLGLVPIQGRFRWARS
jgi:predicted branched-subunit amino acid permease